MILYVDTSALVKLYVDEIGTRSVTESVLRATVVATARISYTEARAAFARHRREGEIEPAELRRIVRELNAGWASYSVVDVSESVVRLAGDLAERHGLRAYDAVHLAAAIVVRQAGGNLEFLTFDSRLNQAGHREGLSVAT